MSSPETEATAHVDALASGQLPHGVGQRLGMEPAGVGDDGDAALEAGREDVFELAQEGARVAAAALARLVEDVHGQLGQPVPGQDVDRPALDHLPGRREPVAEEAAAVGDAQQVAALRRRSRRLHGDEQVVDVDLLPGRAVDRGHGPGAVGPQGVLHLHRLEHDQPVAFGHDVAHAPRAPW